MATFPPLPKSFEEAAQLRQDVEAELERVCISTYFRTSRRSCQFLRYVVRVALDGREDSLKERTIGMDLLCRDVSYDPSSDATVRVRANDVRKRLASFYGTIPPAGPVRILLATGTYVPSFVPAAEPEPAQLEGPLPGPELVHATPERRLPFWQRRWASLAVLLFAALVAGIFIVRHYREQQQEEACIQFWSPILGGKKVLLLSISDRDRGNLASGLYPVVWIAGRFGIPAVLTGGSLTGATTTTFAKVRISGALPSELAGNVELRWMLNARGTPMLATRSRNSQLISEPVAHAALLTILPGSHSVLYAQSTDDDALRKLFETLTLSAEFPRALSAPIPNAIALQVLLTVDSSGQSQVNIWEQAH